MTEYEYKGIKAEIAFRGYKIFFKNRTESFQPYFGNRWLAMTTEDAERSIKRTIRYLINKEARA